MSSRNNREVDERVVQMTFNNAEFEKGVSKSLSTLEKLKRALDFKHRPTGLEDFGKAIGSIEQNLSPIAKDVDHIANRFTALGIIGDQVIRNLTNKVVNFGEKIVKSATVDPLTSGFSEYETQMKSVQTILANTGMEGQKGVARVNAALDELNEYADKTIYNFTEMTNNIGRFTAAGVKLGPAVSAIKGTANLAAMSGSTSEQAARAMYNLSQALSTGTLKLMDWNSVVNAGMGGQVFQNALIQAAAAMDGMGDKVDEWKAKNIDAFGSFRDSLSKGWITSDVLSEALKNFTYDVEEGTKEYEEALSELVSKGYTEKAAKDILKMARQATEAATKVRTFTQLIDTLKEALGSGWSQTWRIVFGDFYEATELWTGISEALGGFIDSISKARNDALTIWKGFDVGGRLDLLEAMKELVYDIALIIKPIADAFHDVFGEFNAEGLRRGTIAFKEFVKQLHPSVEGFKAINKIATSVFSIIKNGITIAVRGINAVLTVGQPLLYLADSLLVAFSDLLDAIVNNTLIAKMITILTTVGRFISAVLIVSIIGLINGIYAIGNAIRSIRMDGFVATVANTGAAFVKWFKGLTVVSKAMSFFKNITVIVGSAIDWFVATLAKGLTYLGSVADYIYNLPMVQYSIRGISNILNVLYSVLLGVKKVIVDIFTSIGGIDLMQIANPLELIKAIVIAVVDSIVSGINRAGDAIAARFPMFNTLRSMVNSVVTAFKNGVGVLKDFFINLKNNNIDFKGGETGLRGIIDAIKGFISVVTPAKLAALAITITMLGMCLTFVRIGNLMAKTMSTFNGLINTVKMAVNGFVQTQTNKIIQAAEAVLMVAAAIAIVAGIPPVDLQHATKAILAIVGLMGVLTILNTKFMKLPTAGSEVTNNIVNLGGVALMILEIEGALAIMVATLKEIKGLNIEGIVPNLIAVLGIFFTLTVAAAAMDKLNIGFSRGTLGILVMTAALWSLVGAIKQIKEIPADSMKAMLEKFIPMLGMLTAISFAAKGIGLTTGLGLILTAKAIEYLIPLLEKIYNEFVRIVDLRPLLELMNEFPEEFKLLGGFVLFLTGVLGVLGKGLKAVGTAALTISASFVVMAYALEKLVEVTGMEGIGRAAIAAAAMAVFVTLWIGLASRIPEKSAILKVGIAIGLMASSLLIMNIALAQLAGMDWTDINTIGAAIALSGMLVLLTIMLRVAGKAGEAKGAFGVMASMMLGLSVVIAELIALSFVNWTDLVMPLISIGTVMLLMAKILKTATGVTEYNKEGVAAMFGVVVAMGMLIQGLADLSKRNPKNVISAAVAMGIVLLTMSSLMKQMTALKQSSSQSGDLWGTVAVIVGVIVALHAITENLSKLSSYDFGSIIASAVAIGAMMIVIGGLCKYISKAAPQAEKGLGSFLLLGGLAVMMYVTAESLLKLKDVDGKQLLASATSLVGSMIGIVFLIKMIGNLDLGTALKGALIASTAIAAFVLAMILEFTLVAEAIKGLDYLTGSDTFSVLREFADNLGSVVGSFVDGIGKAAFASLPEIGTNLSEFAKNLGGFIEISGKMDGNALNGVLNLVQALGAFATSSIIEHFAGLITGNKSIDMFKEQLPKLAEALVSYVTTLDTLRDEKTGVLNLDGIDKSVESLAKIITSVKDIPATGGIIGRILGDADIEKFSLGLFALALGVVSYANAVAECTTWDQIDPSLTALYKIVDIAKQIPNAGGKIEAVFGSNSIDSFGGMLNGLGEGIRDFANTTSSVDEEAYNRAVYSLDSFKKVVDIAKDIPNSGGIITAMFGDNDIKEFGDKLSEFATTFVTFSQTIASTDTHAVNRNAKALSGFVDALLRVEELNLYTFDEIVPHIQHSIESMMQGIIASVGENLDGVEEAVKKLAEAIAKKASSGNSKMREVGREYANRIGKGLSSQGSIDQLATDMETLVGNAFEKVKTDLGKVANENGAEIGQEFVNGIIGPEGIDPDENPGSNEPSKKILDTVTSLTKNAFEGAQENLKPVVDKVGSFLGDDLVQNFSLDGIKNKITDVGDTISKVMNGEMTLSDLVQSSMGGHEEWNFLGFKDIFKDFGEIPEGTDIEREVEKALGGATDGSDKLGKSLKGSSDALNKAKENLKTYNKYLKYSAKVEAEFAKTTGAAMSIFTNDTPINNAKVAVAALAEQIYADSKKVEDAIEETSNTAEDRAIAVMKVFNDDYEAIKNSVSDSIDLFKNFYSEATKPVNPSTIISNMTSQLEGYTAMATKFQILASKGFPMDYIQELAEKGSEGFNELNSVMQFTDEETKKFIETWTEYQNVKDKMATNIMSAKATSLAVEQLRRASAGAKKYNKDVKDLYLTYKKLFKELQSKGEDPFGNEELVKTFNDLNTIVAKTGTNLKALDESFAEHSAESAAAALELVEKYTNAEAVLDKYNTTFSTTKQTVKGLIEEQLNTFETFTKKTSISADDMIDILSSQTKGLAQWSKEIRSLASRGLSQDILDDLAKLGPEGYEKVHAFYQMTDSQISKANELYAQKLVKSDQVSRSVATSFSNVAAGGIDAYKQAINDAAENKTEFEAIISKFATSVSNELTEQTSAQIIAGGEDIGKKLTQSIADGASGSKSTATGASSEVAKASTDAASETIKKEGEKTINSASTGVVKGAAKVAADAIKEETDKTIIPAIDTAGNKIIKEAEQKKNKVTNILNSATDALKQFDADDAWRVVKNNDNNPISTMARTAKKDSATIGTVVGSVVDVMSDYNDNIRLSNGWALWNERSKIWSKQKAKWTEAQIAAEFERRERIEEEIGMKYDDGLKRGLINSMGEPIAAAKKVMRGVIDGQKETAKIHSPSKEGEYIGEMYGVGLAIGIKNTYSQLYSILHDYLKIILDTTNQTTKAVDKVGNVDINARPIVHNDDGSYSTTSTAFKQRWVGDEETGHYIIGHFASIKQNGVRLSDEELDRYIDTVLGSDDPFGTDANMENLLYAIVDKVASGEYINDTNIDKAFEEAEAWDQQMHELQDSMYRDQASMSYNGGFDTAFNFARGIIDGIVTMGNNAQAAAMQAATTVAQMVQSALIQASTMTDEDYDLTHPVITPVIDLSSAQNGFNVLGNMFGNPALDLGLNAQLPTQINIPNNTTPMVDAIRDSQYDDSRLVQRLDGLRDDVNNLNERVGNLQVVMDSGQLVGSIGPKMDQELGNIYRRKNRG